MKTMLTTAGSTILICGAVAMGGIELAITAELGSGDQTAFTVIDFGATDGDVWAFSWSWTGVATTHDMLLAIESIGLTYEWTDWGSGFFVDNFEWGADAGNPDLYWAHSLGSIADSDPQWSPAWSGVDATMLSDGMISGWYNGFNEDFSPIPPSLPLIPAPSVLLMTALLALPVTCRRRR